MMLEQIHREHGYMVRLLAILKKKCHTKVVHPLSFKDNSKGHIRTKYTSMTCNGVGVILPRR